MTLSHHVDNVYLHTRDVRTRTYTYIHMGGNMKTRVAVCEESLFDLRGDFFKGGQMPPLAPPKRNPAWVVPKHFILFVSCTGIRRLSITVSSEGDHLCPHRPSCRYRDVQGDQGPKRSAKRVVT